MLRSLSGRTHEVYTGVSVLSPSGEMFAETDRSDVTFCPVPENEILAYVRSGEPMDKAGAYALQGRASLWITRLEGSYSSVIGLPLYLVRKLLLESGYAFDL
jgi:septum formation protein